MSPQVSTMHFSPKPLGLRHKGPKEINDYKFINIVQCKVPELLDPQYTCMIVSRGTIGSIVLIKNVKRDG